jgi:hypothetical protein
VLIHPSKTKNKHNSSRYKNNRLINTNTYLALILPEASEKQIHSDIPRGFASSPFPPFAATPPAMR